MKSLSNEDVYAKLLERLEISIIRLNKIGENLRYEAEHFQKKYGLQFARMNTLHCESIEKLVESSVRTGSTPSMRESRYYAGGVYPLIKTDNLRENAIVGEFTDCLTKQGYDKLKRAHLRPNDIIVIIIGATHNIIGRSALVRSNILPATINQNIALIRPNQNKIKPEYLVTYLNSRYGRMCLEYLSRQSNQVNLNCREVENVMVPIFSLEFQKRIVNTVHEAYDKIDDSENFYRKAEDFLLSALGLIDFTPSKEQISVRGFKEITQSGRIDAEYYQPVYDRLINKIRSKGASIVEKECDVYDLNYTPEKERTYKYIELSNIGRYGEINSCTTGLGSKLPTRARRIVHTGNIVVSSVEGSLERCALITEEYEGALCSTGFYVIDSKNINSETLLVLFKSAPIQALLKQRCTGTILTAFGRAELNSIPIPNIDKKVQERIKNYITESFTQRKKVITFWGLPNMQLKWPLSRAKKQQ